MGYLLLKAALSGLIIAIVSEVARRAPGLGALIASLPLISVRGMVWLWRATEDTARMAEHSAATFWFVLLSFPIFLVIPVLLNRSVAVWPALAIGCAITITLNVGMIWTLGQFGVRL